MPKLFLYKKVYKKLNFFNLISKPKNMQICPENFTMKKLQHISNLGKLI